MKLGNLEIEWLGHASFRIQAQGQVIYIDPFKITGTPKDATFVFITHPHYDHCSLEDLQKVVKEGTFVIMQADCQSKIARLPTKIKMLIASIGNKREVENVKYEAWPAYNTNKEFHPKFQQWLGYVIEIGGKRIYHSGETDFIPEMAQLKSIDLALLPVSGTYVMTPEEAVQAAEKFKPKLAVPMHYGSIVGKDEDADKFIQLCLSKGIEAGKL